MIRPAIPADAPVVTALGVASGLFPPEATEVTDRMMADYFARHRDEGHVCLIDDDQGTAVAMAYYEPAPATAGTWTLTMIAVRPDAQGRGRGAALMRHVEQALARAGQHLLLVETSGDPAFARTRAFYTRCGYEQEARVRDYYAVGDDMVLFRKRLG